MSKNILSRTHAESDGMRRAVDALRMIRGVAILWGVLAAAVVQADPPQLRYGFQKDRHYAYNVKVVTTLYDVETTRRGILVFDVTSASSDQFSFKVNGELAQSVKGHSSATRPFPPSFPPISPFPSAARFSPFPTAAPFSPFPAGIPFPPQFSDGQSDVWIVSRQGNLVLLGRSEQIPYLLGPKELLIFEPFPGEAKNAWSASGDVRIRENDASATGGWGLLRGMHVSDPGGEEQTHYTMGTITDDAVRIHKKYHLPTTAVDEGGRQLDMRGEGELEFDRKEGVFRSGSLEYTLDVKQTNVTLHVPVSVDYRLLSEAELANYQKAEQEKAEALAEANRPKPLTAEERPALLKDLAHPGDPQRSKAALDRLAKGVVDDQAEEISAAVVPYLMDADDWTKSAAANALKVWATANAELALIQASQSENFIVRNPAIEALGRIKTAAAAAAVAARFPQQRHEASKALRAMGPVAEAATLPCLNDRDRWVVGDACRVLEEIGGSRSVAALEQRKAAGTRDTDQAAIERALGRIKQRIAISGDTSLQAASPPAAASSEVRIWHDAAGLFEVEASFLEADNQQLHLRRKDGRTVRLPLEQLSAVDQAWLKKHLGRQAADAPPLRTWHDDAGMFAVEARFVEFAENQVTLEKKDGRRIHVLLERLSAEDQAWIKQYGGAKGENLPQ